MLKIESIKQQFGSKVIFENVNLEFSPDKVYGVVGANGVGKTTLFRVISGQYKLQEGKMTYYENPITRNEISFLPTDPYFYPYMNGREYLSIVLVDDSKIEEATRMSNFLNLNLDQIVDTYSTGMKKKLAFIAIYIQNRAISIYDEPFNGVDLESNELLSTYIEKQKVGKVTLLSSHILSMLNELCDEILHIEKGFVITRYQPEQYANLKLRIRGNVGI